eukprot:Hpha_TRINITY_DN16103_c2_g1::TRINITY_DN16103_c2_g1_i8::g.7583::m.7583
MEGSNASARLTSLWRPRRGTARYCPPPRPTVFPTPVTTGGPTGTAPQNPPPSPPPTSKTEKGERESAKQAPSSAHRRASEKDSGDTTDMLLQLWRCRGGVGGAPMARPRPRRTPVGYPQRRPISSPPPQRPPVEPPTDPIADPIGEPLRMQCGSRYQLVTDLEMGTNAGTCSAGNSRLPSTTGVTDGKPSTVCTAAGAMTRTPQVTADGSSSLVPGDGRQEPRTPRQSGMAEPIVFKMSQISVQVVESVRFAGTGTTMSPGATTFLTTRPVDPAGWSFSGRAPTDTLSMSATLFDDPDDFTGTLPVDQREEVLELAKMTLQRSVDSAQQRNQASVAAAAAGCAVPVVTAEKALQDEKARQEAEEARLAAEAVERARQEEERRRAEKARQARLAEEARLAAEAAEKAKREEEERLAEEARRAEEARLAAEAAEKAKREEEERLAEEARRAEEARLAAEA